MLQSLSIDNFKSFRHNATIPLKPITLIYGTNSSGKSSIIQSLMLLKQTVDAAEYTAAPLVFRSSRYLDLGSFQNLVSDHDTSKRIALRVAPTLNRAETLLARRQIMAQIDPLTPSLSLAFEVNDTGVVSLSSLSITLEGIDDQPCIIFRKSERNITARDLSRIPRFRLRTASHQNAKPFELEFLNKDSRFFGALYDAFTKRIPEILATLDQHEKITLHGQIFFDEENAPKDEIVAERANLERYAHERSQRYREYSPDKFFQDLVEYCKHRVLLVNQFLPLTTLPITSSSYRVPFVFENRLVLEKSGYSESLIPDIFGIAISLGTSLQDEFNRASYIGPLRQFPERNYIFSGTSENLVGTRGENLPNLLFAQDANVDELNRLAKMMDLGYSVSIHRSRDRALDNVFAVRLSDLTTGANVGLSDVGFGVSQILPILMECAIRTVGTVFIEQPEIHLNPKLQAALGQVLADTIKKTRHKQFIIETHSEHLLLRLQRLVRKKELDPAKISVLYVSKTADGSFVLPMPLDEAGDLLSVWPDGFFDDDFQELFSR